MKSLAALFGIANLAAAQSWPNGPFTTSGRDIIDASGNVVTYAGANWPGAADVMIPEGLQYQSVANIVAKLKELNMNVIRLTYAIELVDQIYENNGVDIPISQAFTDALGDTNGTAVYNEVLAANPDFDASITRLEVSAYNTFYDKYFGPERDADFICVFVPGFRRHRRRVCRQRDICAFGQSYLAGHVVL